MVQDTRRFPEIFASQYATGEISGKLDEVLRRLHNYYQNGASNKLHMLARWVPILVYLGVALYIAMQVLKFWSGYFQNMGNYF
jgi:type II secretory pathway component PulF